MTGFPPAAWLRRWSKPRPTRWVERLQQFVACTYCIWNMPCDILFPHMQMNVFIYVCIMQTHADAYICVCMWLCMHSHFETFRRLFTDGEKYTDMPSHLLYREFFLGIWVFLVCVFYIDVLTMMSHQSMCAVQHVCYAWMNACMYLRHMHVCIQKKKTCCTHHTQNQRALSQGKNNNNVLYLRTQTNVQETKVILLKEVSLRYKKNNNVLFQIEFIIYFLSEKTTSSSQKHTSHLAPFFRVPGEQCLGCAPFPG